MEITYISYAMSRPLLVLLAFGATIGTLLDAMHTFGGATEYLHPFVLRTAWWVPLLFMSAYGFGGFLYALGWDKLAGPARWPSWGEAIGGVVGFAALYAVSAFLPASNVIKLVLLLSGAIALWLWLDRSWQGIALGVVAAFCGPFTEFVLWRLGLFRHLAPDLFGLPMWLPALYLAAGPSFGQFARRVAKRA